MITKIYHKNESQRSLGLACWDTVQNQDSRSLLWINSLRKLGFSSNLMQILCYVRKKIKSKHLSCKHLVCIKSTNSYHQKKQRRKPVNLLLYQSPSQNTRDVSFKWNSKAQIWNSSSQWTSPCLPDRLSCWEGRGRSWGYCFLQWSLRNDTQVERQVCSHLCENHGLILDLSFFRHQ